MADAMGIGDGFDDSDQLHGIPFRLTVWRDEPMRFSCRPLTEKRVVNEMASG
jgi:hypothetical protein